MGKIQVEVTTEPIKLVDLVGFQAASGHGAINMFVGNVRNRNLGRNVLKMEYDCFPPLCEKIFSTIASEAQQKWHRDANILIIHRHGPINIGEASVAILATSGHRDESYKITRYIIEEIKIRAPIWKKEFYQDGETEWVRGHALCQHRKVDHNEFDGSNTCGRTVHSNEARQGTDDTYGTQSPSATV